MYRSADCEKYTNWARDDGIETYNERLRKMLDMLSVEQVCLLLSDKRRQSHRFKLKTC